MRVRTSACVLAAVAVAAGACGSEPGGPGDIVVSVSGESLGGVVIAVTGRGILGFEGLGNTRVYAAPRSDEPDGHRVLLLDPEGGELRFEIQVEDIDMEDPRLDIVSAAGVDNLTQLTADIVTRVER